MADGSDSEFTFLGAIYCKDVLSLLPYGVLQSCRLISNRLNAIIVKEAARGGLIRQLFKHFNLAVVGHSYGSLHVLFHLLDA